MSLARQFFREFRPFFHMLEEPLGRSPAYMGFPRNRSLLDDPFFRHPESLRPAVDVTEHGDNYVVEAEVPGVKKENLQVRVGDGGRSVTIEGNVVERRGVGAGAEATQSADAAFPPSQPYLFDSFRSPFFPLSYIFLTTRSFSRTWHTMALPATSISSAAPRPSEDVDVDMTSDDSENEEIDQLDSDTTEEEEIPIGDTLSPTSKARLKRAGERVPGQSIIPAARIEHILGAEGVGGHMSKEAIYMLSIATEEFVKRLTHAGQRQASVQKRSMIQYLDLETIPMPLTLAEALERRAAKARELLEPETAAPTPSIHSPMPMPMPTSISTPTPSVIPSASQSTKPKALHAACLEYGFFYLDISKYVDPSEPAELTRIAREFFSLPEEEKNKIALMNEDHARGYARLKENVTNGKADNHEGIDFYKPVENPDKTKPLWGTNQWPSIPGFKEKYEIWVEKMKALGLIVMEAYDLQCLW
ncbi:hypothetical protein EW026_g1164 [Hermanssonia centrifuga]|uniref:SHSP domain-containing protein n=1 Tax=Hermanssonia centrifuga TaxID=98765 RepID=A0A4S4KSD9_9APHY|nr:hypothetical protein EW026_g1164 [Hermanssonia centrifuga]